VSFIVIALIGLCWAVAWMLLVTDRPEQNVRVSAAERAAIAIAVLGALSVAVFVHPPRTEAQTLSPAVSRA
jgi:DNA-binding transcriptional regulator PaaX